MNGIINSIGVTERAETVLNLNEDDIFFHVFAWKVHEVTTWRKCSSVDPVDDRQKVVVFGIWIRGIAWHLESSKKVTNYLPVDTLIRLKIKTNDLRSTPRQGSESGNSFHKSEVAFSLAKLETFSTINDSWSSVQYLGWIYVDNKAVLGSLYEALRTSVMRRITIYCFAWRKRIHRNRRL